MIDNKKRILHRVKIVKGHLGSIEKMIEGERYCLDIVHQSLAVQKALRQIDLLIIEDHLNSCVIDQIKSGQEKKTTEELLKLFELK